MLLIFTKCDVFMGNLKPWLCHIDWVIPQSVNIHLQWLPRIGHIRYINILTKLRGFRVKLLYLVLFSLYSRLFWELRDKRNLKTLQFCPESLWAMLEYWYYRTWPICATCTLIIVFMIYIVICVCLLVISFCKAVADYGSKNTGVFVMSTEDYLTNFYPTVQTALDLYYSLAAVNAEVNELGMLCFIIGF